MITAQQIQSEVLTAQQALLREAKSLVMSKQQIEGHQRDLDDLGFSGVSQGISSKLKNAKRLRDLEDQYSFEYPGLKFIPEEALAEVCAKYGLARGHVSRYTGDVPQWALDQIKANKRHLTYKKIHTYDAYQEALKLEVDRLYDEAVKEAFTGTITIRYSSDNIQYLTNRLNAGLSCMFENGKSGLRVGVEAETKEVRFTIEMGVLSRSNLFIAAPRKDMKVNANEIVDESGVIRVEDPIVYLDVPGGCVVLAAWGEEGQDPKVFNVQAN